MSYLRNPFVQFFLSKKSSFNHLLVVNRTADSVMTVSDFILKQHKYKCPGIYGIYCIAEGKFDIGSTYNLKKRLTQHLIKRIYSSKAFEQALGKYDISSFQVIIFETLSVELLNTDKTALDIQLGVLEQLFFDNVDNARLFNIVSSSAPIGSGSKGPLSMETKAKISASNIGKNKGQNVGIKNHRSRPIKVTNLKNHNETYYFE